MQKKKILIIEDDQHLRYSIKIILGSYDNVEVIEAADGDEGFKLAELEKPDLVILDNKMPVISGEQTARLLRGEPTTKNIPIIMTTGMKLNKDAIELIKLDVNDFIQKPFKLWDLIEKIEEYLGPLK